MCPFGNRQVGKSAAGVNDPTWQHRFSDFRTQPFKDHNKRESIARARLVTDEIRGLKILCRQSDHFKCRLAAIWGTDKFQYTAVPLGLIASNVLDSSAELPIDRKAATLYWAGFCSKHFSATPSPDHSLIMRSAQKVGFQANPKWSGILTITDEKMEALVSMCCMLLSHVVMGSIGRQCPIRGHVPGCGSAVWCKLSVRPDWVRHACLAGRCAALSICCYSGVVASHLWEVRV